MRGWSTLPRICSENREVSGDGTSETSLFEQNMSKPFSAVTYTKHDPDMILVLCGCPWQTPQWDTEHGTASNHAKMSDLFTVIDDTLYDNASTARSSFLEISMRQWMAQHFRHIYTSWPTFLPHPGGQSAESAESLPFLRSFGKWGSLARRGSGIHGLSFHRCPPSSTQRWPEELKCNGKNEMKTGLDTLK